MTSEFKWLKRLLETVEVSHPYAMGKIVMVSWVYLANNNLDFHERTRHVEVGRHFSFLREIILFG